MDSPIDFPVPPLCALRAETAVHRGERAVVELIDGRKIIGKLDKFDSDKGKIAIIIDGHEKTKNLGMHEIRLMRIPHPRKWVRDDDSVLSNAKGVLVSTEPLEFNIEFTDHSTIDGNTFGFRNGRHGIHLFPVQDGNQYTHLFVPNNAIARHRIGKHLGQQLIKDRVVSDQDVAMVLLEQQEHRSRSLGEHLTLTAIVSSEQLEHALNRQKKMPHLQLGEILVQERLISQQQLDTALSQQQRERSTTLGELLSSKGIVKQEDIQKSLATKLGIPFLDLRQFPLDITILKLLDKNIATRHSILPLQRHQGKLVVAMEDPTKWETIDALRAATKLTIEPVMATRSDLSWAIKHYYHDGHNNPSLNPASETMSEKCTPAPSSPQIAVSSESVLADPSILTATSGPLANEKQNQVIDRDDDADDYLRKLILNAARDETHAVHLESIPSNGARIRLRKNGELIEKGNITADLWSRLQTRLHHFSHLDGIDCNNARAGLIDGSFFYPATLEVRIYDIPTFNGEHDIVLKITSLSHTPALAELGFSDALLKRIDDLTLKGHGLFLVCGPAGSGKTSLLHALLLHLNNDVKKIWMLDNVERKMPANVRHVRLGAINLGHGPHPIDTILGADPDLISVNPLSQPDIAKRAISGALSGPQILASLPVRGSGEAIERLTNMGVPRYELADALSAVLSLRSIKKLCENCKKRYVPTAEELRSLATEYYADSLSPDDPPARVNALREKILEKWQDAWADSTGQLLLHRAAGCKHCQKSGYAGQLSLHELLEISATVKRPILDGANAPTIMRAAIGAGLKTLKQDGIEKVLQGHTDLIQVRAACAS